jgi:TonB family protein
MIGRVTFVLAIACILSNILSANDAPQTAAELIARARQVQLMRSEGNPSVALKFQITLDLSSATVQGVSELLWESPVKWREEIQLPGSQRLRVGAASGFYQLRQPDVPALTYSDYDTLTRLPDLLQIAGGERAGKIQQRTIDGIQLTCLEIKRKDVVVRKLCFDPSNGTLRHAEVDQPSQVSLAYADFRAIEGKQFPFTMYYRAGRVHSMKIATLEGSPRKESDPKLFVPVEYSEFWGDCEDAIAPELLNSVNPEYPALAKHSQYSRTVLVSGIIEPVGSVSHLHVVQSGSTALDQSVLEAISRWKYKPRMCRGIPVRTETTIETIFEIRR